MQLVVTKEEQELLLKSLEYASKFATIKFYPLNGKLLMKGNEDDFLILHEICQDYLLFKGFDSHYNLTFEGKILEGLIDKIFTQLEKSIER